MPTLLDLPSEIRDLILELCLLACRAAPIDVASAERTRLAPLSDSCREFRSWSYGPANVRYENTSYTSNALPLLLLNRQLHTETQAAIARLRAAKQLVYKLDVMLVKECELWVTWLCVPAVAQLATVEVSVRTFGTAEWPKDRHVWTTFSHGDGSPPQILWCFYVLIEHFLRFGPLPQATLERGLGIGKLVLDFRTPTEGPFPPEGTIMRQWVRDRRQDPHGGPLRETVLPAAWLSDFLRGSLRGLLNMNYHTAAYGGILHGGIDEIVLLVDGAERENNKIDVAAYLKRLAFTDPRRTFGHVYPHEKRLERFWLWKKEAVEKRRQLGLLVYDDTPVDPQ
ncbi:hypothetical protein EXIGLDRAFT_730864 [Exidia glandulosa HHB12029]|uniref:Uncharacterized protein n=1 Tax=Exidia glandulosa HHB12029 TaxID=1314781 RepID=A0A165PVR9_EXIGL|nr:hypothetical protein EXIGLDRAFT_730864 [Exidia glandulosa HHB12029]